MILEIWASVKVSPIGSAIFRQSPFHFLALPPLLPVRGEDWARETPMQVKYGPSQLGYAHCRKLHIFSCLILAALIYIRVAWSTRNYVSEPSFRLAKKAMPQARLFHLVWKSLSSSASKEAMSLIYRFVLKLEEFVAVDYWRFNSDIMTHALSPILQSDFPVARTITVICAIVVAESLLATILFSFIYPMVREFEGVEEQYIGFWAGVISTNNPGISDDGYANGMNSVYFLPVSDLYSHSLGGCVRQVWKEVSHDPWSDWKCSGYHFFWILKNFDLGYPFSCHLWSFQWYDWRCNSWVPFCGILKVDRQCWCLEDSHWWTCTPCSAKPRKDILSLWALLRNRIHRWAFDWRIPVYNRSILVWGTTTSLLGVFLSTPLLS